jgi:hypothetical protein
VNNNGENIVQVISILSLFSTFFTLFFFSPIFKIQHNQINIQSSFQVHYLPLSSSHSKPLKLWVKGPNGSSIRKEFLNKTIKFERKKIANKFPPSFLRSKKKTKKMLQENKKIKKLCFNLFS